MAAASPSISSESTTARATAAASPTTACVTGRCRPIAAGSRSTWISTASGPISRPWRVVQSFRAHPKATTASAPAISSAAVGVEKPPEIPRLHGWPSNSPWATAEVASRAPLRSARWTSPSPAWRAPRPARITGRRACASTAATAVTAASWAASCGGMGRGACVVVRGVVVSAPSAGPACDGSARGGAVGEGAGSAWTSIGRDSTTAAPAAAAARAARASASAVRAEVIRWACAPTARARASWSTSKFEPTAPAGVSAASTSRPVADLAASPIPVSAFVYPHPWCTDTAATRPVTRANASAMVAAPPSCRAAVNGTPAAARAFVRWKLPDPTTPNTCPSSGARTCATASATVRAEAAGGVVGDEGVAGPVMRRPRTGAPRARARGRGRRCRPRSAGAPPRPPRRSPGAGQGSAGR